MKLVRVADETGQVVVPRRTKRPQVKDPERLREVLVLIAEGYTNRMIGQRLGLAEDSVRNWVHALLMRLGAADRAHAVAIAYRQGLLVTEVRPAPKRVAVDRHHDQCALRAPRRCDCGGPR